MYKIKYKIPITFYHEQIIDDKDIEQEIKESGKTPEEYFSSCQNLSFTADQCYQNLKEDFHSVIENNISIESISIIENAY